MKEYNNNGIVVQQSIVKDKSYCCSCEGIEKGQVRYRWRLTVPNSGRFFRGGFWTEQCRECFDETLQMWTNGIIKIKSELEDDRFNDRKE